MDTTFIRDRITELRLQKGISEYKMSMDLGHSKSYVQSISSGKSLPSLSEFLYICDYFDISPKAFFDTESHNSQMHEKINCELHQLNSSDLKLVYELVLRLNNNETGESK